jgi:hypothetical protein
MTTIWIAFGTICAFFALSVLCNTRRELGWARRALRAMYDEPEAGWRLRRMTAARNTEATALLADLGRYYRSDYERHGKAYADSMAREVYARCAVAVAATAR